MHSPLDWLGPASSIATVLALVITLLYYLYWWPFHLNTPAELTAQYDNGKVKLRWGTVHRASSYSIYRTEEGSGVTDILSCAKHFYDDAALAPGNAYRYHVIAEDQGHQSLESNVVFIKVPSVVSPPGPLTVGGTGADVVVTLTVDSPEAQWPTEDLRRLFAELRQKDNKTVLALLEITASKPDTLVSFSDVCERASVTGRQGGAGIGALTLLIKRLGKTKWPFTHHPSQTGQYYKLSQEMAKRWQQVEAEGKTQGSQAG